VLVRGFLILLLLHLLLVLFLLSFVPLVLLRLLLLRLFLRHLLLCGNGSLATDIGLNQRRPRRGPSGRGETHISAAYKAGLNEKKCKRLRAVRFTATAPLYHCTATTRPLKAQCYPIHVSMLTI